MKTIRILSVDVTNFKSISKYKVDFPQSAGLRFLSGDNQQESALGANGAGKTTLWQSIQWCLYGYGRLSNLTTWGATDTEVVVRLDISGVTHNVKRSGPPTKSYVDSGSGYTLCEQPFIDNLLGLSKLTFPHAVFFNQGYRLFPDLSIPERGELLEEVLRLSFWGKCSETTTTELSSLEKQISSTRQKTATVEGKLLGLESIQSLENKRDRWEQEKQQRILNLTTQRTSWEQAKVEKLTNLRYQEQGFSASIQKEVADLEAKDKEYREEQLAAIESKINKIQELEVEQTFYGIDLESQIYNEGNVLSHHELQLTANQKIFGQLEYRGQEAFKDLSYWFSAQKCSACGQEITAAHRDSKVNKISTDRLDIQQQCATIAEEIKKRTAFILESKKTLADLSDKKNRKTVIQAAIDSLSLGVENLGTILDKPSPYAEMMKKAESRTNPYIVQIQQAEKAVNPYNDLIQKEQTSINPVTFEIEKNQITRTQFQSELDLSKEETTKLESKYKLVEYWKQGFKRLRIFLINRVLSSLQIEVNSAASALGLAGWKLGLQSETETKSGTTKLGVQIQVQSPTSPTSVPWESWSGGETQRLRMALALGLASMLQRSSGCWWEIEVFDEPATYLSAEGVENLLATLEYRAEVTKKSLWVVDHTALVYSGFKEIWVATKGTAGTQISQVLK